MDCVGVNANFVEISLHHNRSVATVVVRGPARQDSVCVLLDGRRTWFRAAHVAISVRLLLCRTNISEAVIF